MPDRDLEALEATLDAGPWLTLLALADLHEEGGDDWRADGYRWLVKNRRRPDVVRCMYFWSWTSALEVTGQEATYLPLYPFTLLFGDRNPGLLDDLPNDAQYAGEYDAYDAAAVAVGLWLRRAEAGGRVKG